MSLLTLSSFFLNQENISLLYHDAWLNAYLSLNGKFMESHKVPTSHDLYVPLIEPGCNLNHLVIVIKTGQLKNHEHPMFAICAINAGTTYHTVIPR